MIKCKCINNKNKPKDWYDNISWLEEKEYHITNIHVMMLQGKKMGYSLAEISLPADGKYSCFLASRFAINPKDLPALLELMEQSSELSSVDVSELTKELELETV